MDLDIIETFVRQRLSPEELKLSVRSMIFPRKENAGYRALS